MYPTRALPLCFPRHPFHAARSACGVQRAGTRGQCKQLKFDATACLVPLPRSLTRPPTLPPRLHQMAAKQAFIEELKSLPIAVETRESLPPSTRGPSEAAGTSTPRVPAVRLLTFLRSLRHAAGAANDQHYMIPTEFYQHVGHEPHVPTRSGQVAAIALGVGGCEQTPVTGLGGVSAPVSVCVRRFWART